MNVWGVVFRDVCLIVVFDGVDGVLCFVCVIFVDLLIMFSFGVLGFLGRLRCF